MRLRFSSKNFILTVILFVLEVVIALFVHDKFVRPYVGDYLVVFLVYYAIATVIDSASWKIGLFTLLCAYAVECLQYFKFVQRVGLEDNVLARTVIGVGFEWLDIVAYTLGVLTILIVEHFRFQQGEQSGQ